MANYQTEQKLVLARIANAGTCCVLLEMWIKGEIVFDEADVRHLLHALDGVTLKVEALMEQRRR